MQSGAHISSPQKKKNEEERYLWENPRGGGSFEKKLYTLSSILGSWKKRIRLGVESPHGQAKRNGGGCSLGDERFRVIRSSGGTAVSLSMRRRPSGRRVSWVGEYYLERRVSSQ